MRLLLHTVLIFISLFTMVILVIRAQPYDASELRVFLALPDACPAPCIMGIRPEVTTIEEAVTILKKHEWVDELDLSSPYYVSWTWSGLQPEIVNDEINGIVRPHYRGNIVETVVIATDISVGDVFLLFGEPDKMFSAVNGSSDSMFVSAVYLRENISISNLYVDCPFSIHHFWYKSATFEFNDGPTRDENLRTPNYVGRCNLR